jgi:hypothetical protein
VVPQKVSFSLSKLMLLAALVVSGAFVAARGLLGPFTFPVKVSNPVHPEGWFGLAFVIGILGDG